MLLHATETGKGPPICLLHGLFGRSQNLGALARRWSHTNRVIALDLRNHGQSPHAPVMSYDFMAADVLLTLGQMNALPCRLLGHSMGGKVAMTIALNVPKSVSGLTVADIAPLSYSHGNQDVAAALLRLKLSPGLTRRDADAALAADIPNEAVRGFLLQNLVFGPSPHWRIGLAAIEAAIPAIEAWPPTQGQYMGPTLFIRGEESDYVPNSAWPTIRALFPAAKLVTIPRGGHWVHADQPAAFAIAAEDQAT